MLRYIASNLPISSRIHGKAGTDLSGRCVPATLLLRTSGLDLIDVFMYAFVEMGGEAHRNSIKRQQVLVALTTGGQI